MITTEGDALWIKTANAPKQYGYLNQDIACEVAVVGGGLTGALVAHAFAREGVETVLLERNILGYGGTAASGGIVTYAAGGTLTRMAQALGMQDAVTLYKMGQDAVEQLTQLAQESGRDCGFSTRTALVFSPDKNCRLRHEYKLLKKYGFDTEYLDDTTSGELFSFPLRAGVLHLKGAAQLDPFAFLQAVAAGAAQSGARIYENTPVQRSVTFGNGINLVTANGFKVKARKAVWATGNQCAAFLQRGNLSYTRCYSVATQQVESFDGWGQRSILREAMPYGIYLRTAPDNRMLIGGLDALVRDPASADMRRNGLAAAMLHYEKLRQRIVGMFPNIPDPLPQYRFNGIVGHSLDGLPYVGACPNMDNCYMACCCGRDSALYAAMAAQVLVQMYNGTPHEYARLFDPKR